MGNLGKVQYRQPYNNDNLYSQFVLIKLGNLQSKFKLHMSLHQKKIILYQQHLFQVLKLRKLPSKECRICKKHVHITY